MIALLKAKDLIEEFSYDNTSSGKRHGKKCALIAVDEIYNALFVCLKNTDELQNADREFAYWEEVKQEIQNL